MTDQGCQLIDLSADRIRDHCPFVAWRMVYRRRLPAVVAAGGLALRQDAVRVGGKVISLLITHHSASTESLFSGRAVSKNGLHVRARRFITRSADNLPTAESTITTGQTGCRQQKSEDRRTMNRAHRVTSNENLRRKSGVESGSANLLSNGEGGVDSVSLRGARVGSKAQPFMHRSENPVLVYGRHWCHTFDQCKAVDNLHPTE